MLIAFKGNVGKIGIVPDNVPAEGSSNHRTAGQSLMILRLKARDRLSPHVLYEYLSDEVVQEHLKSLAGGSAILDNRDERPKSLAIPLPDEETQAKVAAAVAERQNLYRQIEQLKAQSPRNEGRAGPTRAAITPRFEPPSCGITAHHIR